ncbi:hypothetical protein [Leucobacter luti]|nr:hypothetical protein [Leucobacter luti]
MGKKRVLGGAATAAMVFGLIGCAVAPGTGAVDEGAARTSEQQELLGGDVIAPVTQAVGELQGARIALVVGQSLVVDTAGLDVASYRGDVADPEIAVFTAGLHDDSAEFHPGITALAAGSTEVTLTHEQGGIEPLHFEVLVSPAP